MEDLKMFELISALKLGIEDLERLSSYLLWLKTQSEERREEILRRADRKIPEKAGLGLKLCKDLCYERSFCERAGLNYNSLLQEDTRLIRTSIAYYLLNKD